MYIYFVYIRHHSKYKHLLNNFNYQDFEKRQLHVYVWRSSADWKFRLRYTLIVDFFCSICDLKFVVQINARKDMIKIGFLFTFGTSCFIIQMRKKGRLKLLKGWLCFSGMSLYALHRVIFNSFNFLALTYLWNFDKLKKYF